MVRLLPIVQMGVYPYRHHDWMWKLIMVVRLGMMLRKDFVYFAEGGSLGGAAAAHSAAGRLPLPPG